MNQEKYSQSVSVVIPCYNEADNIRDTLSRLHAFFIEHVDAFEFLVINDGCKDGTDEVVEQTMKENAWDESVVKVLSHTTNQGYGAALRTGFYNATMETILLFPGDGQFDVREVGNLLHQLSVCPTDQPAIVWPYRSKRVEGLLRKLAERAYHLLIWFVLGVTVRDIDCGFKLYRRQIFEVIPKLTSSGALIDAEILFHSFRRQVFIKQVPVTHLPRRAGEATGLKFRVVATMFRELLALKKRLNAASS